MSQRKNKNDGNVEINLIPFISLLSVLICALLVNAIWIHVGQIEMKQAIGQKETMDTESLELKVKIETNDTVSFIISEKNKIQLEKSISLGELPQIKQFLQEVSEKYAFANTSVEPSKSSSYQSLISVLELLRASGQTQLSIVSM